MSVSCDLVPLPREGKGSQFWPECLEASDSAPLFGGVGLTPNSQNVERLGLGRAADPPRILYLGIQAVRCFGSLIDFATVRLFGCRHDGSEDCNIFTDKLIVLWDL